MSENFYFLTRQEFDFLYTKLYMSLESERRIFIYICEHKICCRTDRVFSLKFKTKRQNFRNTIFETVILFD